MVRQLSIVRIIRCADKGEMQVLKLWCSVLVMGMVVFVIPAATHASPSTERARLYFASVDELVAADGLAVGDVVHLYSYYGSDDAAAHRRVISDTDDGSGIRLKSGLYANLITDGTIRVKEFGVLGNGVADDTEAFMRALDYAFSRHGNYPVYVADVHHAGNIVVDLQGLDITLRQGYRVTKGAGVTIQNGTISAASEFDPAQTPFLLDFAGEARLAISYLHLNNLFVRGNYLANGIRLDQYNRVFLTDVTVVGQKDYGIVLDGKQGSHEAILDNIFIGHREWNDPRRPEAGWKGVGLQVNSSDNIISNVVIFQASTGIEVTGSYNLFNNIHTWGTPEGDIVNYEAFNKYTNLYVDGSFVELKKANGIHISDAMFHNTYLKLTPTSGRGQLQGFSLTSSSFHSHGTGAPAAAVVLDHSEGTYPDNQWYMKDVVFHANTFHGSIAGTHTQYNQAVKVFDQAEVVVDLSHVFQPIGRDIKGFSLTFSAEAGSRATPIVSATVDGLRLVVHFNGDTHGTPQRVTGTLHVWATISH